MARFLANENVPADVVTAAQKAGLDLTWVHHVSAGAKDEAVLALAQAENRVLVTFDKDFGELAFRRGCSATPGIILLRPRLRSPLYLTQFFLAVVNQPIAWEGHFAVAEEGRLRVVPLPP